MESKKVDINEATPSTTAILDTPSRDVLDDHKKSDNAEVSDVYPPGSAGKLDPALKRRVLKGTILNWIFGTIAYIVAFAIFTPMFLRIVELFDDKVPDVASTSAILETRLFELTGKTDAEFAEAFANNLGSVFVNAAYDNTSTEVLTEQTTSALGMLASSLPVESAMKSLVPLATIAKATSDGDRTLALERVSAAVQGVVGDPTVFMDNIRDSMAGLASYTGDAAASAALVPVALGGAMYQALGTSAEELVSEVSTSFFEAAKSQALNEMFDLTWIALLTTWCIVVFTGLLMWYCRDEPEIVMYNNHFKRHWIIAGLLLCPIGVYFAAIPLFQITTNTDVVQDLYLSGACIISFIAVLGFSAPIVWMGRSWFMDCTRSKGGIMNNYFFMAPWHFFLVLLMCSFHIWGYFDHDVSVMIDFIPIFFTVVVVGMEFSHYSFGILLKFHRQDYYAGFWPAGRMLTVFGITFMIGYIWCGLQNSKMLAALWIPNHLNCIVFGATIDIFWLPIVQALGRKFNSNGKATFNDWDIVTLPTEGQLLDEGSGKPMVV
ncbi:hypothetical protein SARC_09791 [Sphaeroforma arctica JP610]|uniref:Uncharacterized protein n=1 Tax=Sphaeroforma arctica JP610 TaxID=667725 RepID=A0A0L0FLX5_9EUKA|nr:hypothetical protein SARC_09791 [Sphaeroforma arctica JP610]KNC77755.1 hypothetical protein SARC_09791 [Sphaeroforma arctica JP610]|eukprot:XP_014151657.1 hypothetical protein SARC_09791 [Sphaeroforma arctica JP610]